MNNNNEIVKIRDYVYKFLYFDKLACHVLAEYYCDLDMILEFQLDYDNEDKEIFFILSGNNLKIDYGNGKSNKYDKIKDYSIGYNYENGGNYIVRIKGNLIKFSNCSQNIKKVINWNYYLEDLSCAFYKCKKLEVPNNIPKNVKNMSFMFHGCSIFNSDLLNWNVQNVQFMHGMFHGCSSFNSDLSNWNVQNVQNMSRMFSYCYKFNSNLSNWNVQNVINMSDMFYNCSDFNSDLSNWNVQNVQFMHGMFSECKNFNCDISKWNVQNVRHVYHMFYNCTILEKYKPEFKN